MSTKYRFSDNQIPHFITLTLVQWIDLFTKEKYKELIVDSLKHCIDNKGLVLHAYVIMSNHMHLIVSSEDGDLSNIIRDFKRFTAIRIYEELKNGSEKGRREWLLRVIKEEGKKSSSNKDIKIWIHENHPILLDTNKMIDDRLNYIHENPVTAGVCYTPEDYKYSSAGVYAGEEGVLDVEVLC